MIYRFITGLALRYPAWVLACWTALLVLCGSAAISLPSILKDHGLRTEGTSAQVERILSEDYQLPHEPAVVVFEREPGASRASFESGIRTVLEHLRRVDGSLTVISPLEHEGGFRSIIIPVKALLMNLLSLTASFGVLVYFFQDGMLGGGSGSIAVMIPVFIFGLVFGVSMDYGVFLLSRMTEVYHRTGNADKAIAAGLSSTGKVITSAAAIMIAVTLPFIAGDVEGVRQLGFGIAAAILIDATLIRFMLVPALMKLMGHVNWWLPHQLRRWLFTE
ncbi:MMPL family transporter [Paenibacillus sp. AR247]|uniref:MMPL family transporter n=1 Tax=Paenibacillus sp. AR247 TaxID=1631599 RepID=UPI002156FE3B|nr:MMPL family transporter [Paenibacillus sp. AR247]